MTPATDHELPKHRGDIQGLRAVAVLAVVTFHARLPLPGGFVGVDAFFVISGFVITGMLHREWARSGTIRLRTFWKRRFLRLTPALAVVVAATVLAAGLVLYPDEQRLTVLTGLGALALVANVVIARNTGGYFDAPAEANPLLNMWSLSVEEQFYLLFPLLLVGMWALSRHMRTRFPWALLAVALLTVASFLLSVISQTEVAASITWLNFYSPFVRAWEFAVGALLALATVRLALPRRVLAEIAGGVGALLLIASFFLITPATPFPGWWALLPVTGTALLLLAGSRHYPWTSRVLGTRSLTAVGDWSYSIYLWHWPFIVFMLLLGSREPGWLVVAALASFVPALLSYRLVEQPLRRQSALPQRRFAVLAAMVIGIPIAASFVVLSWLRPMSVYAEEIGTTYLDEIAATTYPCTLEQVEGSGSRCRESRTDRPIDVVLLGDSHAEHLYLGLTQLLPESNIAYVYLPNWPTQVDANVELTLQQVESLPGAPPVIVGSRWTSETAGNPAVEDALARLSAGGREVFVIADTPVFSFHSRECKYQRILLAEARCDEPSDSFDTERSAYLPRLTALVADYPSARILDAAQGFCQGKVCSMVNNGVLLFADHGHLNGVGSRTVAERLTESNRAFADALGVTG